MLAWQNTSMGSQEVMAYYTITSPQLLPYSPPRSSLICLFWFLRLATRPADVQRSYTTLETWPPRGAVPVKFLPPVLTSKDWLRYWSCTRSPSMTDNVCCPAEGKSCNCCVVFLPNIQSLFCFRCENTASVARWQIAIVWVVHGNVWFFMLELKHQGQLFPTEHKFILPPHYKSDISSVFHPSLTIPLSITLSPLTLYYQQYHSHW